MQLSCVLLFHVICIGGDGGGGYFCMGRLSPEFQPLILFHRNGTPLLSSFHYHVVPDNEITYHFFSVVLN